MHSVLRNTLLCVALLLPAFASAQSTDSTTPATAPAPSAAQAAAQPATTPTATAATTAAADNDSPPAPAGTGKIGPPAAGKGQVVFFREKKFAGSAIQYMVREGTTELGKISSGVYFVLAADPGKHTYTVHSEAKDDLTLEVEAGETYYVISSLSMGFMAGHPHLAPSDQATFDGMADRLRISTP
jgi:hypothetical protein